MTDDGTLAEILAGLYDHEDPADFLREASERHPELAKELGEHIALLDLVDEAFHDEADAGAPRTLGPYEILAPLGRGGMGVVYLAQQEEPIKRRVAVKLLSENVSSPQARARFEVEREALALMDHPNIARVLDAGVTAGNRPYVVLEYVQGVALTDYCVREKLNLPARLALFVEVCEAVNHAHQKGVLHRDIKPSNVLVAEVDGRAVPKVIDFGLAKSFGEDTSGDPSLTIGGQERLFENPRRACRCAVRCRQ